MIAVLTSVSYDATILPAFVKYYAGLGAEVVFVTVLELKPNLLEETKSIATGMPIPVHIYPANERWVRTQLESQNKNELRAQIGLRQTDWYVPADLDEFIDFQLPLRDTIAQLQKGNYGYAMGTLIDRMSSDGTLTEYDPSKSLWEQYPLKEHITRDIMQSNHRKVVLARGHLAVSSGHHLIVDESHKKFPQEFMINHFAWRAGRREALQRRFDNYSRLGIVSASLNRMLTHLAANEGRISIPS
jgi:hypothetical protein